MAENTRHLPYTEVVERVQELSRDEAINSRPRCRSAVQDCYLREIPNKEDWSFYLANSAITTLVEYKSGTVTIQPGSTQAVFSTDVSLNADFTGRKIKFTGNDLIYDTTYESATSLTVSPPLSGTTTVSNGSYSIFKNTYALASDFDRFPQNGGLLYMQGGRRTVIKEVAYQDYADESTATPSNTPSVIRLVTRDTAGNQLIELIPPSKDAKSYPYDYFRLPRPLRESSGGTVQITTGVTAVVGIGTKFTEMQTGDWLRISDFGRGADSEWYQVSAIATDTNLTLATVFGTSGANSSNYIVTSALDMPIKMQPAVLYGAVRTVLLDQNDEKGLYYKGQFAEVLSDGKRIYKTRIYGTDVDLEAEDFNYRV